MVIGASDHSFASIQGFLRRLRSVRWHTPPDPCLAGSSGDSIDRLLNRRMVKLHRHSIADRQIGRADEKQVDSFDRGDLFHAPHGLTLLDLKGQEGLLAALPQVLEGISKGKLSVGTGIVKASGAQRRVTRPLHPLPGLLSVDPDLPP